MDKKLPLDFEWYSNLIVHKRDTQEDVHLQFLYKYKSCTKNQDHHVIKQQCQS